MARARFEMLRAEEQIMEETALVITGMGAVTPVGVGVPAYWNNLVAGVCGIGPITRFDTAALPVRIAAEVRDFDTSAPVPGSHLRNAPPFMQFAWAAAKEALDDSGIDVDGEAERIGVVMGSALGGITLTARTQDAYSTGTAHKISPYFVPGILGNMAAARIAIAYGLHGPNLTINTACSSGGDAMLTAALLLRSGEANAVLAVGGESILCPIVISSLAQARALSRANDHPQQACRPFDLHRDGFVIGEGGGAVLIETEYHARARNADIKAAFIGYANTNDGHHITAPPPHGAGAIACMRAALRRAGLSPADVGYINAHGTSTPMGDRVETEAIKNVFGAAETAPPVSSTKGATGHLMAAGGITEVIACVQAIREGVLPPTLGYRSPDPTCDLDYVPNMARRVSIRTAMSNSFGFGGQNSSIIVTRYPR